MVESNVEITQVNQVLYAVLFKHIFTLQSPIGEERLLFIYFINSHRNCQDLL